MTAPAPSAPAKQFSAEEMQAHADRQHAATVAQQQSLREAQNANARQIKLEKLSRRDPAIRDLLEEHRAAFATIGSLRTELDGTREVLAAAKADAKQAREDLDNNNAELVKLRQQLADALKPKK